MTPFQRDPVGNGSKAAASLAKHRCPYCRVGFLECVTGRIEVEGRMVEAIYNRCPRCGENLLAECEYRRVTK